MAAFGHGRGRQNPLAPALKTITRICPSYSARRAADTAAYLVDHLLPEAGYRQ